MIRFILLISLILTIVSCKKEDKFPDVALYGHGGSGIDIESSPYEENTIEAIDYALSYPEIAGVEVDIQWSLEGTAWVYHDEDLSTQTNKNGCLRTTSDATLEEAHYVSVHQERIPKLNEIASHLKGRSVVLDIKNTYNCGDAITDEEIQNSMIEFNALLENTEVIVVAEDLTNLSFYQSLGWKVFLNAYTISDYTSSVNWEQTTGVSIRNADVTAEEVKQMKAYGKEVIIFEAKAPKSIRKALKKRPTMFLADDIRAALIEKIR